MLCVPAEPAARRARWSTTTSVFDAAQVRLDLALEVLRDMGIARDRRGRRSRSVHRDDRRRPRVPARRDRHLHAIRRRARAGCAATSIERVSEATRPAGDPRRLRRATRASTCSTSPSPSPTARPRATSCSRRSGARPRSSADEQRRQLFIVVVPQEGGDGHAAAARAHAPEARARPPARPRPVRRRDDRRPRPYTAIMNALQYFRVDDIVISTLRRRRSPAGCAPT